MRSVYLALILSLTLLSFSNHPLAGQQSKVNGTPIQYNFGQQYQIQSKILSEDRQLLTYVPEEYHKSNDKFPVVYILEGDKNFKHAVLAVEKMQTSGWMPASIVVAITDNDGTNMRDYFHERENFQRFINKEVKPFVTRNFRANGYTTLFGHRRSATFVLETFIKMADQFDSYIAANPYIKQPTLDRFEQLLDKNKTLNQALYFSMGTVLDNGSYNVNPAKALAELLNNKAPKSLQWHYSYQPLHGVFSSANATLLDGLSFNFTDYQGPFISSHQEFVDGNGMDGVKAYFKMRANKYHISDKVTVGSLMGLGFMLLDSGHPKVAIKVLIDNINNSFPESVELHRVLGRAYEKMADYQQAARVYEKMVSLAKQQNDPRLDDYQNQLKRTKQKL